MLYVLPLQTNADLKTDLNDFNVFFINGVWNKTSKDAEDSAWVTDQALQFPAGSKVQSRWNSSQGELTDLLETYLLYGMEENQKTVNFWSWLFNLDEAPQQFRDLVYEKMWQHSSLSTPSAITELGKMKNDVMAAQSTKKKTIIISHSEGNFFSNNIVDRIIDSNKTLGEKCTGILAVATPSTRIANNGPWVTSTFDMVINAAKSTWPGGSDIKPANVTVLPRWADLSGHMYVETYLSDPTSKAKFIEGMSTLVSQIKQVCDVTPCGGSVSAFGKNVNHTSQDIELGTGPGNVTFEYEAYSIPDSFEVKTKGGKTILAKTGLISGIRTLTFDPSKYFSSDATSRKVIVKVYPHPTNPDTEWTYTMGCPSKAITNADRSKDLISTKFSFSSPDNTAKCTFKFNIDGVVSSQTIGTPGEYIISLSQGTHAYKYESVNCGTLPTLWTYSATYTDSTGKYSIKAPPFGQSSTSFVVH